MECAPNLRWKSYNASIYWVLIVRQWMRNKLNIHSMILHITSKNNIFWHWLNICESYSQKGRLGWVHLISIWLPWSFGLFTIPSVRLWGNLLLLSLLGVAVSKLLENMGSNPREIGFCSSKQGFRIFWVWVSGVLMTGSIFSMQRMVVFWTPGQEYILQILLKGYLL